MKLLQALHYDGNISIEYHNHMNLRISVAQICLTGPANQVLKYDMIPLGLQFECMNLQKFV